MQVAGGVLAAVLIRALYPHAEQAAAEITAETTQG
jgi:hypothetical protein